MCLFHYGQQLRQQRVEMWVSTKLVWKISAQEKTMALSSWLIATLSPPNQRRWTRTSSASSPSPWLSSSPSSYSTSSLSAKVIFRWKFENRSHSQSKLEVGPISEKNPHRKPAQMILLTSSRHGHFVLFQIYLFQGRPRGFWGDAWRSICWDFLHILPHRIIHPQPTPQVKH